HRPTGETLPDRVHNPGAWTACQVNRADVAPDHFGSALNKIRLKLCQRCNLNHRNGHWILLTAYCARFHNNSTTTIICRIEKNQARAVGESLMARVRRYARYLEAFRGRYLWLKSHGRTEARPYKAVVIRRDALLGVHWQNAYPRIPLREYLCLLF